MNRAPLPPINFNALADALLSRSETIVPAWLPGGRRSSHEWVCGGMHGGKGTSCSVNLRTGCWADFASDEKGGDLVSLYAAIHGLDQGRAAVAVARDEGLEDVAGVQHDTSHQRPARPEPPPPMAKPARQEEGWTTVRPVPPGVPAPTFKHFSRPASDIVRTAEYRLGDELHGYVVRFRTSDGGKDDLPYTWCTSARDGAAKWHWRQFDEPRPLYLPGHSLPASRTVILVEGERKGEVLQQLLDAQAPGIYCVVGWPGGCKAWAKADWSWITGSTVLAWPDTDSKRAPITAKESNACADDVERDAIKSGKPYLPAHKQPGMAAMLGIGRLLEREHGCKVQLLAIDGPGIKPDGWDAADAIETDGWDFARVLAFFATAYALPPEVDQPAAPEPPAAKKIDGPVGTDGSDSPDSPAALPWWLECFHDPIKNRWNLSRKTIIMALRHDPELQGVLGYNELSNTMEARRDWPFPHGRAGKITGAVDLLLGNWLSKRYGLPSITRQAIMEGMETVAYENPWHPVRDWLGGLQWDGKGRADKWLIHAISETPEALDPRMREYLTLVGRYWLIGMVMRVMEPGSKFDYCPVLEGPGGLGKSTMVETLASSAWYSDTPFEIGKGKESQEQVQGIWGYELGELSQMGKGEITAIKAFISSKVDRYRPAYGRVVEEHPRQCVLVGTTNESTYLRDRTGNRRFWPIPVRNPIRIEWLAKWRTQLFAEAYSLYLEGLTCIPTREQEGRLFSPVQESRLIETAVTSELLAVLTRPPTATGIGALVNQLTDFVTLAQLVKALDMDAGKSTAGLESQIRSWMTHQGWVHKKRQVNGVRAHGWERPADWPAPDTDMPVADAGASTEPPADDEPF
ncbi:VapE domain-containing protein [Malikia sp.]|uniref:VapE domain-containing protein n=1 Tax=Malikia sp. TaxID=2070706 RepID=UPI0026228956|nr:VapE domain-containing protein [Malikia sp.]MDD2728188.1 VapE family protein [Malikia sp.]